VKRSCSRQARACYRDDEEHAEQAIAIAREGCDGDDDGRARAARLVAAQRGNPDCMFELYVLVSTGRGLAKDEARAAAVVRAAAHDQGRVALQHDNMGSFHATGRGPGPRTRARILSTLASLMLRKSWPTTRAELWCEVELVKHHKRGTHRALRKAHPPLC
jgi:TPR repeat protein